MSTSQRRYLGLRPALALLGLVVVVGIASVTLRPEGATVAVWWPAAGLSAAVVALAPPGLRSLVAAGVGVAAATFLANLVGGRAASTSVGFGLANAGEAVVAGLVLRSSRRPGPPTLADLPDLVRLLVAALTGGTVVAAGIFATVHVQELGSAWQGARVVFASHAAAVLVVLPLFLVRRLWSRTRTPELVLQSSALVLATVLVFLPAQELALTFVPLTALVWAALRFPVAVVTVQLVAFAAATTYFTSADWGPFTADPRVSLTVAASLNQVYLVCAVLLTVPLALVLAQRNALLAQVRAEEVLFRGSFTDSLLGQLLLRERGGRLRVVDANGTAGQTLGRSPTSLQGVALDDLVEVPADLGLRITAGQPWRGRVAVVGRPAARVEVGLSKLAHREAADEVWSAQLLDVSAEHDALTRLEAAEKLTSTTLDTTAALVLVTDLDGRILRANAATSRLFGYDDADLVGHRVWETGLASGADPDLEALFVWPNRSGQPVSREGDALTRAGERRRVTWSNNMVRDERGMPAYAVLTGIDVTTERASAGLVTHLMQAAITTAILGLDASGRVTVANAGAEHLLGTDAGRLVGQPFLALLDPDQVAQRLGEQDHAAAFSALVAGATDGEIPARDWVWLGRDGQRHVVSMTLSPTEGSVGSGIGYLCLGRDVTEQRQGQDMLVAALEKERTAVERLRAIDEAKDEFVSTVSHELRTPVTSIVGYTEMLQDGTVVEPLPDQLPLFDTIARNGQRLIVLCNDLLLLSGLDSGSITWQAEEVDLGAALDVVEQATAPLLAGRDLDLLLERPDRPATVVGDRSQLERVLLNLVSNAVKFTEDGGVVRVRVEVAGDEVVLTVTDTGLGIPAEEQDNLFQKFFRSSTAQREAIQGTGLGLSIVSAIVAAHGGTVRVRSAHLEGATFTVRLPVKY